MSTIKANNYEASTAGNTLIFNTGGSEMMRIVPGSASVSGVGVGLAGNALTLNSNGTTVHIHEPAAGQSSILHCTNGSQGIGASKGFICGLWGPDSNKAYVFTYDPVNMLFGTSALIRMTITSDGNVGIGTQTPAVDLDVVGEARSSTSTTSASNANTLTTKDYVDNEMRVGSMMTFVITSGGWAVAASGTANNATHTIQNNNNGMPTGWANTSKYTNGEPITFTVPANSGTWNGCAVCTSAGLVPIAVNISNSASSQTVTLAVTNNTAWFFRLKRTA
jgi:hypothetical protein